MKARSTYIFVDNFEDYKFYREKYKSKNVNWVTSSPYLIHKIKINNESVVNLENYLSSKIINELMKISYKLSDEIINHTYVHFSGLKKKDVFLIFYRDLSMMIGSFLYKYYALICLYSEKKNTSDFIFIGNEILKYDLNHPNNIYDNVVYDLAKNLKYKNFKFFKSLFVAKKNPSFKTIFINKFISLLNLNLNSFFYKIYRSLPFKFYFKEKKKAFIFKEVYNFENNFFKLIKKFNLNFINFQFEKYKFKKNIKINKLILNKINSILNNSINSKNYFLKTNYIPCLEKILFHHFQIILNYKKNHKEINRDIEVVSKNFKFNDLILSNTLERPLSLYFYLKLKKIVKFAFFEHGQTSGFQKSWDIRKKTQTINLGNYAFFSHQHSLNVQRKYIPKKTLCKVIGASSFYFKKKNLILKIIIQLIIGIPFFKRKVVYVADLFRNNSTYSPHIGRDLDILNDTKEIVQYLNKKHANDFKILKTYPTSLYKDDFNFDKISEFEVISNYNWMNIYYVFDEIYFSAIQSSWLYKNKFQKIKLINRYKYPINYKKIKKLKKLNTTGKNFKIFKLIKEKEIIDDGSWIKVLN